MRLLLICLVILLSVVKTPRITAQEPADQAAALSAEKSWLLLIDQGNYQQAWASAAKIMQQAATEPDLAKAIAGARAPLGALATRTFKQAQVATHMPGAPDGHYLIAQYSTKFANKADGIETVVASQDPDGTWHVSGYFIR